MEHSVRIRTGKRDWVRLDSVSGSKGRDSTFTLENAIDMNVCEVERSSSPPGTGTVVMSPQVVMPVYHIGELLPFFLALMVSWLLGIALLTKGTVLED